MRRSRFISEWEGDSLDSQPDPYARIAQMLEVLQYEREHLLKGMQSWSSHWSERVKFFETQTKRMLEDPDWNPGWSNLGEIQGNFTTFDFGVIAVFYLDEVISALKIILSERPQECEPTGKVCRTDAKKDRATVRKRGNPKARGGSR